MSRIRCLVVDAFADRPFAGNPAAVCLLDDERDAEWMQSVAAEMNLSETAFVRRLVEDFELRWFTPTVEVDLCGHATLASAHVLWSEGIARESRPIYFRTRSGILTCVRDGDRIELDFPAFPAAEAAPPAGLLESLGATALFVGRSRFDSLVLVESEGALRGLRPDFARLRDVPARGVIVTSAADDPRIDFVSRFFAPAAGIDEDPVTGSAHCTLGPFWGQRLGKSKLKAFQASRRGGTVHVRLDGDRVVLGGQTVTVLEGWLV
jgi:predicted PhzF superfamily epimerase YddE/YHI9